MNGNFQEGDIVLGEWKLAKLLGQGSYGKVFAGEREDFGVIYRAAIKIITIPQSQTEIQSVRSEGLDEASVTAYFRSMVEEMVQEFGIMSKLKGNSNIVSYEDHRVIPHEGEIGWDIIIRMEQLTPMLDYMGKRVMEPAEVAKVGIDMCRALELCVRNDIIHRDIKPENMFVNDLGDYKLGDFGIARTIERNTGAMSKKGTYTYMAPEIYKEEPYDARVDIYSLGIVLYRLLNNNRPPFLPLTGPMTHSQREQALLRRISGAPLPPPSTPCGALADIVLKACAYKPDDRWSDPTQMREALERYVLLPEDKAAEDEEEEEEGTVRASAADLSAYLKQEDEGTVSAVSYAPRPSPKPAQQTGYQVPRPAAPTPAPAAPTPAPAVTPAPAPAAAPATRPAATPAAPPEPAPAAPAADLPFFASPSFSRPTAPAPAAKPVETPAAPAPAPSAAPAAASVTPTPAAPAPAPVQKTPGPAAPTISPVAPAAPAISKTPEPVIVPAPKEEAPVRTEPKKEAPGRTVVRKKKTGLVVGLVIGLIVVAALAFLYFSGMLSQLMPEPTPVPTVAASTPAPTPSPTPQVDYNDSNWDDSPIYGSG